MKTLKTIGRLPTETERDNFERKDVIFYNGSFQNENDVSLMSGKGYSKSVRRTPKRIIKAESPKLLTDPEDDDLTFTWIGHSSFLLQMGDKNILVDPILSSRSSPVSFAGPKRFSEIPVTADRMPETDIILLSHDHYDHMDYDTLKDLRSKVREYIVPLGVDSILKGWGIKDEKIHALGWWENIEINGIVYTLTPSQHFTGRDPLKRNRTLWGGFYISNGIRSVYYTGDGGYCDVFKEVKARLGSPELMISECGQYDPSWSSVHMFPEEVVQASVDTDAGWLIPVHWGTFCICNHAWDDSIIRVTAEADEKKINISTPRIGQTVNIKNIASYNEEWWKEYE